jgi:hypothetical protein
MATKFEGAPAEYKQRFLDCKAWGHNWKHTTDFHLIRNTTGTIIQFTRQVVCNHCKTERHDVFDRSMRLASRQYYYPDGYQTTGEQPIVLGIARQEFIRRLLIRSAGAEQTANVRELHAS